MEDAQNIHSNDFRYNFSHTVPNFGELLVQDEIVLYCFAVLQETLGVTKISLKSTTEFLCVKCEDHCEL